MTGHIDPTKEAFAAFRANDRPGAIHMLNLVRFRDRSGEKVQDRILAQLSRTLRRRQHDAQGTGGQE